MTDRGHVAWVVQNTSHDYAKAEEWGRVKFLFSDKPDVFNSDRLVKQVTEGLSDSRVDDYLIPSGSALAVSIAFSVLLVKHGVVNVLLYSFRNNEYEVRSVRRDYLVDSIVKVAAET